MSKGVFIIGTDTGIGKTWFTLALMEALKKYQNQVAGMKPIASGAQLNNGKLMNGDARLIMQHCSEPTDYELINPIVFELPVSPHIAARQINQKIKMEQIISCYKKLAINNEKIIVEGVGGWRVPLSDKLSIVDLVRSLDLPVILVVGLKLGCISHALLTAEAIEADGIRLIGWVSSRCEKGYLCANETIETLMHDMPCPYLADLPHMDSFEPERLTQKLDLNNIF